MLRPAGPPIFKFSLLAESIEVAVVAGLVDDKTAEFEDRDGGWTDKPAESLDCCFLLVRLSIRIL